MGRGTFVVRTSSANPLALASILRLEVPRVLPGFRVTNIRTQTELVESTMLRERLLKLAWGYDYYGDSRTVDVHVTWLREKLRESTARIQTVWGVGYKLVEAEPGEAAPARRRRA